ncbi:MAG TPA: MaoC family dehydratase [Porticoccaceae bacterium]|jgi:acyl dehydratase|nr:MaoC family dehydratase [Gammaproteobacteria bacterium]HIF76018.1 MaoC family dehydratase [Gammaproteobacteria bacterium]HIL61009.1 MaoC family dehydratase [Porticoccaceae bacterium]|tara:strand:+ start:255 stop:719 length:465 start_codon:yes stop_codon:yes gene_type:complete
MSNLVSVDQLGEYVGKEVGVTDWLEVDQDRINKFADATGDHQYIHIDAERAAETPFGTTIAHGFLTLSLLSMLGSKNGGMKLKNSVMGINYGLDKVRFINPVKVDAKIRARFQLISAEEKKPKHYLMKHNVTIEIDGEEKPALIAEWLGMTVLA